MTGRPLSLASLPATPASIRLALGVLVGSGVFFAAAAPFARIPLARIEAFIPVYQSALVINDLVTAALLFGQFNFLGSRSLLVLTGAYLFTAFMTVAHALSFPGLFAPGGLLGAGIQTTAWLYMFWHGGFPLLVIVYALLRNAGQAPVPERRRVPAALIAGVIALAAACVLTLAATVGQDLLAPIMQGNRYTPLMVVVVGSVWGLSLIALVALWRVRPRTVLDLWLMVVMCAWLFDIALSAILNAGRFDLGFYAGRIYGLLASSFVLIVLLYENNVLYARLLAAHDSERHERQLVQERTEALVALNKELDAFSYSVSHDLRAPLRAIDGFARMLEEDYGDKLDAEGRRLLGVVRASSVQMARLIDDLLAFSRVGREELRTMPVEVADIVQAVIAELAEERRGRAVEFIVGRLSVARADPALLKQAIANLIANAVKFTSGRDPAIIEVGCRANPGDADVYYVKDNGCGFDMKYYDRLFGVFQRLHGTRDYPGTGVGLAIVSRIVSRHGGRVWAEAREGEGATFYFTLAGGSGTKSF